MKKWYRYEIGVPEPNEPDLSGSGFFNRDYGRLWEYFKFIQKNIGTSRTVLSVGCGDCALEYRLMKRLNLDVTCTDIRSPHEIHRQLGINYRILDITKNIPDETYDAVITTSLLYQFDYDQLVGVLKNISKCLRPGGLLIMDYGGSPPKPISNFIIDVFLPMEMKVYSMYKGMRIQKNHAGYRTSTENIVFIAEQCGFVLKDYEYLWDVLDFRRSMTFRKLVPVDGIIETIISTLIKDRNPYLRLMKFEKSVMEGDGRKVEKEGGDHG